MLPLGYCYHRRGNTRDYCCCYLVAHEHYLLVYQNQPELVNTTDHRLHPKDRAKSWNTTTASVLLCPSFRRLRILSNSSNSLVQTACPTYLPQGRLQMIRHARKIQENPAARLARKCCHFESNPSWIKTIWPGQLQTQGKSLLTSERPSKIKNNQRK